MSIQYAQNTTLHAMLAELHQLSIDEGIVLSVYKDSLGYLTFGCGTLITEDMPEHGLPEGTPVSEARCAMALFEELTEKTLGDGEAVFGPITWAKFPQEAKQVFLNMLFNLGRSRFNGFRNMISAALEHDWERAADEALDSRWSRQVKGRATRLASRLRALA